MAPRSDFLTQPAPENYVAGLGRGATGFTTRSDLGPAREGPSEDQIKEVLAKRAAQLGTGGTFAGTEKKEEDDNEAEIQNQDPENEVGLFATGAYDREDDEADRIYQTVDERMEKRRKQQREDRERKEREDYERKNPKIQQQFADLKRALGTVTDEDWASIPEVGDLTGKNKRVKRDNKANNRFYAVPDSVIAGADAQGQYDTSVVGEEEAQTNGQDGDGTTTNFADIGKARDKVLQVRLDQAALGTTTEAAGTGSATNIDPKGYLTSLSKATESGDAQVGDIKRVRTLLESVTKTNPKHAPGWIATARLEELAGKQVAARNSIARGCENCPKSVDAWLENIRLNEKYNARIIAATALKHVDDSTRLWMAALDLEDDTRSKKRVMRHALDHKPNDPELWKEAVNLEEDPADARLLLAKATDILPSAVELWLALARLETPEEAQKVLNKARKAVPSSFEIWVAAARLQEQMGEPSRVDAVMKRGVQALAKVSAMLKRDEWVVQAESCEEEGAILTCNAIIRETLGYDLDEDDDRKATFLKDASACIDRNRLGTARAIYAYSLRIFPTSTTVWTAAAALEREHGDKDALYAVLDKAVAACPHSEELWLSAAHEKQNTGDIDGARETLARAFRSNNASENIWLAAVRLESDTGLVDRARQLLAPARAEAGTDRVWIKSVAFERAQKNTQEALDLVSDGLARYPKNPKLHMQKGQIYQYDHDPALIPQAREAYLAGTRAAPKSAPLWLLAAQLEESQGALVKARSLFERARIACPHDPRIWTASIRIERRAGNTTAAQSLMARALQDVAPAQAGLLWAERIWHLEPRNQRKALALEAIKKVDNDAVLFVSVARIFWAERRLEKASAWFEKALVLDSDYGDAWGWYGRFLEEQGARSEDARRKLVELVAKCVGVGPRHGEVWARVRKDPGNARKSVEEVLRLVMAKLGEAS